LTASVLDSACMVMVTYLVSRLDQYSNSYFKAGPLLCYMLDVWDEGYGQGGVAGCRAASGRLRGAGCAVTYYWVVL
jgi:hypothetical protein